MSEINTSSIRELDAKLVERYSSRLDKFGDDPRTLGWDTLENQFTRFNIALNSVEFTGKKILDIGCGFADFRHFLNSKGVTLQSYTGCDINKNLLDRCRARMPADNFFQANIIVDNIENSPYNIVTLFGVLNFRFPDFDNLDFARRMIKRAYELCDEVLIVDFLSSVRAENYPAEDFVYYYNPDEILKFALSITPYISLKHDYRSLPQREMMLILSKSPCI